MADRLNGSDYRVKLSHPRRQGQPLRITGKDGRVIAVSGENCKQVSTEDLVSMIANGYVELIRPGMESVPVVPEVVSAGEPEPDEAA